MARIVEYADCRVVSAVAPCEPSPAAQSVGVTRVAQELVTVDLSSSVPGGQAMDGGLRTPKVVAEDLLGRRLVSGGRGL